MSNSDELLILDDIPGERLKTATWRVLSVDDDEDFQAALAFSLRHATILDRNIELLQARSMAEALKLLARSRDIAVVLVDMVMESEDAGLQLTKAIRTMLGYADTRIVLLTGQPGFAPIDSVMHDYDLSDYCLKSEINRRGIKNILTGVIRSYRDLSKISFARRSLNLILETSNRMVGCRNPRELASIVLDELARILSLDGSGIVCVHDDTSKPFQLDNITIVGATGALGGAVGQSVACLPILETQQAILEALRTGTNRHCSDGMALYFPTHLSIKRYAVFIACQRELESTEHELLKVFIETAARGFGSAHLLGNLETLAFHDKLVDLPNRTALLRQLDRVIKSGACANQSLIKIDIDDFGGVCVTFGREHANKILVAISEVLRAAFPPPLFIARGAPDLFFLLGRDDVITVEAVMAVFEQPLKVEDSEYRISACYALLPSSAITGDAERVMAAASTTMRVAKANGPGSVMLYQPTIEERSREQFKISANLAVATRNKQLYTLVQPQIDMNTGAIIGGELLLRWDLNGSPVPPDVFIPIAERSALIHDVGRLVIGDVLGYLGQLAQRGQTDLVLSINTSPRELAEADYVDRLLRACEQAGVSPARLEIEILESTVMQRFDVACAQLSRFRQAGGRVALDDFGTGMTSLAYLMELPYDRIKIDRRFVHNLCQGDGNQLLAKLVIQLAHSLGKEVLAEGVETPAQVEWLRENGCRFGQGWYYAKALPFDEFLARLG